jgi:hypothetical protein
VCVCVRACVCVCVCPHAHAHTHTHTHTQTHTYTYIHHPLPKGLSPLPRRAADATTAVHGSPPAPPASARIGMHAPRLGAANGSHCRAPAHACRCPRPWSRSSAAASASPRRSGRSGLRRACARGASVVLRARGTLRWACGADRTPCPLRFGYPTDGRTIWRDPRHAMGSRTRPAQARA